MPKEKGKYIGKHSLRTLDLIAGRAAQEDSEVAQKIADDYMVEWREKAAEGNWKSNFYNLRYSIIVLQKINWLRWPLSLYIITENKN
jgi:hypothetical protein